MSERRSAKWAQKPRMIGPPAAIVYDDALCRYPGLIRVSFDDGHTMVYAAYQPCRPRVEETTTEVVVEYEYVPKKRRPGVPSVKRRQR